MVKYSLYMLLGLFLLTGCQKELCMDHHHDGMKLNVRFDWAGETPSTVKGMILLLYPEDGSAPLRFTFSDPQGGTISVTSGNYRALCLNDNELLRLENTDDWNSISVTTGETNVVSSAAFGGATNAPRAPSAEEERVLREPPLLYTATNTEVYVKATDEAQELRFTPKMPLSIMQIRVEDVENVEYIQTVSGAVTGLSSSLCLTSLKPSADHCTMPVQMHVTADGALEGTLRYFGHCPDPSHELSHALSVYTMLIDWSKQQSNYNISSQLHDTTHPGGEDEPQNAEVIITEMNLPEPRPAEGGFQADLNEWSIDNIDIQM